MPPFVLVASCLASVMLFLFGPALRHGGAALAASRGTVHVRPGETDEILRNPGMGFADFHFARGKPPLPGMHPVPSVAYFRWTWKELEPEEGSYNFDLIDNVIREAGDRGETLAFRVMSIHGDSMPKWLLEKGVDSVAVGKNELFPDHNSPVFLDRHERLLRELGRRYDGRPEIDHVDIGTVGCWGEWNTACCPEGKKDACRRFFPSALNRYRIVNDYLNHFTRTPLVMLAGGPIEYAASRGAGWRGDCFGDYGMFRYGWSHMISVYERIIRNPATADAWQTAPVQFEVCYHMQDWHDRGYDIEQILRKGLDWHMSVLNAKSSPVPAPWRESVDRFLKKIGYRFVLREMDHPAAAAPGETIRLESVWENRGVAPIYRPWPLAYRLRSAEGNTAARWISGEDLRTWLPGSRRVEDTVRLPGELPPGLYSLDVAILREDASAALVEIAIEGKLRDKWYSVSSVEISASASKAVDREKDKTVDR